MYSAQDTVEIDGETIRKSEVGPSEFIKFHDGREQQMKDAIHQYDLAKTYQVDEPAPAFSSTVNAFVTPSLTGSEQDTLQCLAKKTLPLGFLSALLDETHFQQWIRLSIGTRSESWFHHLFDDTLTAGDIQQFDEVCQQMQDKLFELATNAVLKRTNENQSFEFDLHEYHRSQEFSTLCVELPGRLADHHAGCVMLFMSLSRMFSTWLKDALVYARKKRNPELFHRRTNTLLSNVQENNETNRFVGWAIYSSRKFFSRESSSDKDCKELLSAMLIREREIDEEYMSKYYDESMSLLNRGGLTLVSKPFFEWGKKLMATIRAVFDEAAIDRDPKNAFENSKQLVLSNVELRSSFLSICEKKSLSTASTAKSVYDKMLTKTIHARFAVVFRQWKERNVEKKNQVAFRTKLKAQGGKSSGDKSKSSVAATKKNGSRKRMKVDVPISRIDAATNRKKRRIALDEKRREKRMKHQATLQNV